MCPWYGCQAALIRRGEEGSDGVRGVANREPMMVETAVNLGRADEALYYSKDHGRNQVNGFDELVMRGQLRLTIPAGQAEIQSDIDEIFL